MVAVEARCARARRPPHRPPHGRSEMLTHVNVNTTDATTGATALLLPAHV